jgi:hypothetical protein
VAVSSPVLRIPDAAGKWNLVTLKRFL